jgi:lipid-A-disaccharide synthase
VPSDSAAPQILISAGEASGDMHAARLARALQARSGAHVFGMGGPRMKDAGVELVADAKDIAVLGITEVIHKVPTVLKILRLLRKEAARRKPALAILVDSPGTNLPLAKKLRRLGVPVVYFIAPQVWAWRPWRIRAMKKNLSRVLVIFPFEEEIYRNAGIPVDFVGHPLVDVVKPNAARADFLAAQGLDASRPVVALLPGSRPTEISLNLPAMLDACESLARDLRPQFTMAAAPGLEDGFFQRYLRPGLTIKRIAGAPYDVLASADCAIVSSGTATVEAALLGTPMVVVYRVSQTSAFILRRMIRSPHLAMVNLIAGKKIVPELIQDDFTGPRVEAEVRRLLSSSADREEMKRELAEVRRRLGSGGAIDRAADALAAMLPPKS